MKRPVRPIHGKERNNYERVLDRMHDILNGSVNQGQFVNGVAIQGNTDNAHAAATSPGVANTDFPVTHNLGRIPTGFLVVYKAASCDVYAGATAWTTTQIFLRCTAINVPFVFQIY